MIVTEKDFNASESGDGAGSKEPLTKLDQMREIIIETFKETGRKMLIFSNYYNSFTKIAEILSETGVKYKEIKGTGSSVNNIIRMYKETDELNCLLLNSTNIGAGLNLENTTDLVLYHNMSSELSIQVIGRAQRPEGHQVLTFIVWYTIMNRRISPIFLLLLRKIRLLKKYLNKTS